MAKIGAPKTPPLWTHRRALLPHVTAFGRRCAMAQAKRIDRAQRVRARRQWLERHGAFASGVLVGATGALVAVWLVNVLMK